MLAVEGLIIFGYRIGKNPTNIFLIKKKAPLFHSKSEIPRERHNLINTILASHKYFASKKTLSYIMKAKRHQVNLSKSPFETKKSFTALRLFI